MAYGSFYSDYLTLTINILKRTRPKIDLIFRELLDYVFSEHALPFGTEPFHLQVPFDGLAQGRSLAERFYY